MNMKRSILLVFFCFSFVYVFSQEKSILSVSYDCLYRTSEEQTEPFHGTWILNHGETSSQYYGKSEVVNGILFDHSGMYRIYKNLPEMNRLTFREGYAEKYYYTEEMPNFSWEMLDGDTTICSYSCQKAVTHFRGRTWYVWYSVDLPYNDGPWKLCGLPGLIMKAEDSKGDYSFTASKIEKGGEDIRLDIKGYKNIKPLELEKRKKEKAAHPITDDMKNILIDIPKNLIPKPTTVCFMEYFDKD